MPNFMGRRAPPPVPQSLSHDAYELNNRKGQDSPHPPADSTPVITPYLSLRSRLSQIWFNRWTVLLVLVLVHFLLTIGSLNDGLGDAKVKALSACTKVEDVGSAMASMPHYLSVGVNRLTATGITESVHALMTVLDMIITGIEQLILFVIAMMTDTYVCLISMVVHGGINATMVGVEKTTEALNKAIDGAADGIASTADDIQGVIDKVYDVVNSALPDVNQAASDVQNVGDQATSAIGDGVNSVVGDIGDGFKNIFGREQVKTQDVSFKITNFPAKATPVPVAPENPITVDVGDLLQREIEIRQLGLPPKPDLAKEITDKMNDLKNVNIDSSGFVADLKNLEQNTPTFDDIKNLTGQAVSFPFNLIREQLNEAYGNWSFDDSIFPVAKKEALSFCSDNSILNDFFEGLFQLANTAKIVAVVLLSLLAVAACVPMAYMEIRRYRRQKTYAKLFAKNSYDSMDCGYMFSHPTTARAGIALAAKVSGNPPNSVREIMTRWFVAYATSLPAIFVLSLALAGFFSCFCQFILLKTVEKQVPALANQVGDFAEQVVDSLGNVSQKWADDANGVITSFSSDVNDDILGKVTNATSAVNDTLNTFMHEIDKGINMVFGETLFKDLATETVRCLLGLKVEAVQRGLTWVHDHARIDFPLFPNDVFSIGAAKSISDDSDLTTFLASPSSVTTDEVTDAVYHVVNWLQNNIIQDALIATGLLLVYIVVVLIGMIYAMSVMINPPDRRGRGIGGEDKIPPSPGRAMRSMSEASIHRSPFSSNVNDLNARSVPFGTVKQHPPAHTRTSSFAEFEKGPDKTAPPPRQIITASTVRA